MIPTRVGPAGSTLAALALLAALAVAGCTTSDGQHVGGDAEPVGLAPVEAVDRAPGRSLWAVALAVSDQGPDDPKLHGGLPAGFQATVIDVDCDAGARDRLQLRPRPYWYAAVYFTSQETGFRFKDRYGLSVVGIVLVQPASQCG